MGAFKKYIVSFSGGKDSTAMLLMMLEKGLQIDDIVFMDTGVEFPEMYEHIEKVEKYINHKVTRLKAEKSFEYMLLEYEKRKVRIKDKKVTLSQIFVIAGVLNILKNL